MIPSTKNFQYALQNYYISLCVMSNVFIRAFCHFKINFYQTGPLKLIKTMLKYVHLFVLYFESISTKLEPTLI